VPEPARPEPLDSPVPGPDEIDPQARQLHNVGCGLGLASWGAFLGGQWLVLSGGREAALIALVGWVAAVGCDLVVLGLFWRAWRSFDEIWIWAPLNFLFLLLAILVWGDALLQAVQ
jgi:hypothetical protein